MVGGISEIRKCEKKLPTRITIFFIDFIYFVDLLLEVCGSSSAAEKQPALVLLRRSDDAKQDSTLVSRATGVSPHLASRLHHLAHLTHYSRHQSDHHQAVVFGALESYSVDGFVAKSHRVLAGEVHIKSRLHPTAAHNANLYTRRD